MPPWPTRAPLAGFTVTDGQNTTTSDVSGNFVLPAPAGVALAPTVTGPMYTTLHLPEATASGVDLNRGAIPIPSSQTFGLEQQVVANDQTMALIQVTLANRSTSRSTIRRASWSPRRDGGDRAGRRELLARLRPRVISGSRSRAGRRHRRRCASASASPLRRRAAP